MLFRNGYPVAAVILLLGGTFGACAVQAADPGDVTVGLGVSTLGATVEGAYRISETLGARVPVGYLGTSFSDTDDGLDFDLDLNLGGVGLLGDYYPGGGGFRLSGGVFYNAVKAEGSARGDGNVGDTFYTGVDLDVDVEPKNRFMPALAIGYDAEIGSRWVISGDLGAMYTGGFKASVRDRTGQVSQADIDDEIGDIEDGRADFYPYIKLGVAFRF